MGDEGEMGTGLKISLSSETTLYTEKVALDKLRDGGVVDASLVLQPASLKLAPGSPDKVSIKYITRRRD